MRAAQIIGTPVEAPLKGDRTYLHSTDLWIALERLFRQESADPSRRMTVTFRRFTNRAPLLVPFEGAPADRFADVRISDKAGVRNYCLVESATEVAAHVDCPERALRSAIALDELAASVTVPDFATSLECLVATAKTLHLEKIEAQVKWVVGRLELPLPFPAQIGDRVSTAITHRLPRQTTVSDVAVNGRKVGSVMFNVLR